MFEWVLTVDLQTEIILKIWKNEVTAQYIRKLDSKLEQIYVKIDWYFWLNIFRRARLTCKSYGKIQSIRTLSWVLYV